MSKDSESKIKELLKENINHKENENENQNLKIDNLLKELDFFKIKCDIMEKDLFKSQTSNKKNEAIIKKLQDMNALYGKVI
jgi:hypothetical protein